MGEWACADSTTFWEGQPDQCQPDQWQLGQVQQGQGQYQQSQCQQGQCHPDQSQPGQGQPGQGQPSQQPAGMSTAQILSGFGSWRRVAAVTVVRDCDGAVVLALPDDSDRLAALQRFHPSLSSSE
jgi:hypothetical protein